jgi:predicted CoA-substrate-specific enzyme activase
MDKVRVGLDIGSTTIKMIVLDENNDMVFHQYLRHLSDITATLRSMIAKAQDVFYEKLLSVMVTGSAGIGFSQDYKLSFIQEVVACSHAIKAILPATDTAIELGGEDAKITYFNNTVEQRMNGVCAGGTGAFIDHMAALLGTDPAGLNELAKNYQTIYPIASRCGVFAKTDVQALLNEGATKEDIAASVLQAVVNQTISGLAQGRPISGKVAFLGGPLHFLSELRKRFIETLQLKNEQVLIPEYSHYFVAIGAALALQEEPIPYGDFAAKGAAKLYMSGNPRREALEPLFADEDEYARFRERHAKSAVPRASLADYAGDAYLGIDAGSTTTKMALIGEDGSLLYSYYGSNMAKPVDTAVAALKELYAKMNGRTRIANAAVTGYGESLAKVALQVDIGEVETVAHYKAANHFLPGVSFVLDIGGQDMKSFFIKDGVIESIMLNEACSAGCGSFIENFAQSLGMGIREFTALGLKARHPVDLGTRCTVFMNSKVKQAHKDGAEVSDIAAGIAVSIVRNALYKVIRIKSPADLGDKIVVQGGTFYNDAVLRALEKTIGCEVIRPDMAGIMGAYGAALIAKERCAEGHRSTLIGAAELAGFTASVSRRRCENCGNNCLITVTHFSNGQAYYSGNRCERGAGKEKAGEGVNFYAYKYKRLFGYAPLPAEKAPRGTIGIPRALNMYEDYPFWFTFFTALGYRVVLSGRSSRKLYESGMETIPSDSVCYPAKLVHGHIADLVGKGVKKIFYPCIPFNIPDNAADNRYNCPIVTSYPENISANMDAVRGDGVTFRHPFLPLDDPARLVARLRQELAAENLPGRELVEAVRKAYAELAAYKEDVRREAKKALASIRAAGVRGIVLAGRPYHIDPEINHGVAEMIQSYGLAVLSEDAVCHLAKAQRPLRVVDQWVYHSRLYDAAAFVARQPDLELIQLNSFGCGLDAITVDQVKDILDTGNKIHTVIKLDEVNNLGAAKIRVRSLIAALNERRGAALPEIRRSVSRVRAVFSREMKQGYTILAPQMSPVHFRFIEAGLRWAGYNVEVLRTADRAAVDEGLKYVHNDACYPAIIVIGQAMAALKSGRYDTGRTAILMPQTGGGCRATNYIAMLRKALEDAGLSHVPVISLSAGVEKTPGFSLTFAILDKMIMGTIYGDLLSRVLYRVRPYERVPGSADRLYEYWAGRCEQALLDGGKKEFRENIRAIVRDFDSLEIIPARKPRVGIVGEILVNYHPFANNDLVALLENEGAEAVVPDLMDFILYCAYDRQVNYELLAGSFGNMVAGRLFIKAIDWYRDSMRKALQASVRFAAPLSIDETARKAAKHLSLGNLTGEGWLLTGKMVEMIDGGVSNIVCLQPFACLPNQITGKGMIKELRRCYPGANIVPIDYDPGASEVNQLNRIKLMLSVARDKLPREAAGPTGGAGTGVIMTEYLAGLYALEPVVQLFIQ